MSEDDHGSHYLMEIWVNYKKTHPEEARQWAESLWSLGFQFGEHSAISEEEYEKSVRALFENMIPFVIMLKLYGPEDVVAAIERGEAPTLPDSGTFLDNLEAAIDYCIGMQTMDGEIDDVEYYIEVILEQTPPWISAVEDLGKIAEALKSVQ
jgi:hypothetical protein